MYEKILKPYAASWAGLLRIAAWTALFLWLAGLGFPALKEDPFLGPAAAHSRVVAMTTDCCDTRQIREDALPARAKLDIAWVGDSTLIATPPGLAIRGRNRDYYDIAPRSVSDILHEKYGLGDFDIRLYAMVGGGALDTASLVMQALDRKPDMVVLALNPLGTFFSYKLHAGAYPLNAAPALWMRNQRMRAMIPLFASPGRILWSALGRRFPAIRNAVWTITARKHAIEEEERDGGDGSTETRNSVGPPEKNGWLSIYNMFSKEVPLLNADGWPLPLAPDPGSMTYTLLNDTLDLLAESGVPALIYVPPVSPDYRKNAQAEKNLSALEDFLRQKQRDPRMQKITIVPRVPDSVADKLVFNTPDPFHLVRGKDAPLNAFLAAKIGGVARKAAALRGK